MYISRVKLDTQKRSTMRAMAEPKLFHGAIEHSYTGERKRLLWRTDHLSSGEYLLIVSQERLDLTNVVEQFGFPQETPLWEEKVYDGLLARAKTGTLWHFRLAANPIIHKKTGNPGERGKVLAHVTVDQQRKWLMDRSAEHGFELAEGQYDVVNSKWIQFSKHDETSRVVLHQVTFEGTLRVSDADKFQKMLCEGIGRGKAYGMGMMTITSVRGQNHV